MSTYWYYECLDHTPPLRSTDEFTQHTADRHYRRGIDLIGKRPVEVDERYWRSDTVFRNDEERSEMYFTGNATRFLVAHPTCRIGVVNEYDERPKANP